MGFHDILHDQRLLPLLAGTKLPKPSASIQFLDGSGTPNFRAMARADYVLWSLLWGTAAQRNEAVTLALAFLAQQRKEGQGHWLGELGAPAPHDEYHLLPGAVLRLCARKMGHAALREATGAWWRGQIALFKITATPDGEVLCPGLRVGPFQKPSVWSAPGTQVGSFILRAVLGKPHVKPVTVTEVQSNDLLAAGRVVLQLLQQGDRLGGAAQANELPYLRFPLVVDRYPRGHIARLELGDDWRSLDHPCGWTWAAYDLSQTSKPSNTLRWGKGHAEPPPPALPDWGTPQRVQSPRQGTRPET